jgi:CRP-like cAMP-binding protein
MARGPGGRLTPGRCSPPAGMVGSHHQPASGAARRQAKNVSMDFLTGVDLFQGVSKRETQKIAKLCAEKWFPRGATIFSQGDGSDSLYVLKRGLVKLVSISDKGTETILHILNPDEIFGELLLSEEKRAFTAIAIEDAFVTVVLRGRFINLLSLAPTVAVNFIRLLSKRLARVEKGLAESSHTWSYHRLANVLLQLSEKYGEEVPAGTLIKLRLTHEDLANLIGTTRETVTTQLNKFSRMGLLKRQARHFIVTRPSLTKFMRSKQLQIKDL